MSEERARKIKAVILDVDGILTDGRIYYGNYGDELKAFHVHDGLGLELLKRAGVKTIIITAKKSAIISRRAKELKIDEVFQNCPDKLLACQQVMAKYNLQDEEICFMGDDLLDIPVMKRCGFAVTVPQAHPAVRDIAHYITQKPGGGGAVREAADFLLKAQNKWDEVTQKYFS